ncbi:MAG: monofunctional biosynthetic peptidoglycan transglycosylase [Bacteroidales bacterium]|nr:monofunctional biosynthetic peptidoglycan transglycosylase [Bacteroidales bacterium]
MAKKSKKSSGKKQGKGLAKFLAIVGKILLILFVISLLLPLLYKWVNPNITPLMIIRKMQNGTPIEHQWVDIDDISQNLIVCAVAAEDNNFLGHNGFDYGAIERAMKINETGKKKLGASTISQQTAKNVFLWPSRTWFRKGCEVYFTFLIEKMWGKERIMEVYLNVIEMGDGIYGCEAASQHYFHKSASKVSRFEAALLTSIYPAPLKRNPAKPTIYLTGRAAHIVALSAKFGKIRFDEESVARARERYEKREAKRRAKNGKQNALLPF